MNKTTNYNLSQWAKSDQVKMEDFNADNAKIDAAIKAVDQKADGLSAGKADASALTALTQTVSGLQSKANSLSAALEKKGTCVTETFTYTGTGKAGPGNPTVVRFRKKPIAFLIFGPIALMLGAGSSGLIHSAGNSMPWISTVSLSWSGGKLSFFLDDSNVSSTHQLNVNTTYQVIAFYTA